LATFELLARELPDHRNYLVVAGIEQALDYLEGLRFTAEDATSGRRSPLLCSASTSASATRCASARAWTKRGSGLPERMPAVSVQLGTGHGGDLRPSPVSMPRTRAAPSTRCNVPGRGSYAPSRSWAPEEEKDARCNSCC
jgi:hypothetical protein